MNASRRTLARALLAAGLASGLALAPQAQAQDYPKGPIRFIVPVPARTCRASCSSFWPRST
jgi:tripartite-type tricarboxylate transporter receptor subunit TctC